MLAKEEAWNGGAGWRMSRVYGDVREEECNHFRDALRRAANGHRAILETFDAAAWVRAGCTAAD